MTDSRGSRGSRGRSRKDAFLSEQRFDALPIDARSLRALAAAGITHLSRPQAEYLPAALAAPRGPAVYSRNAPSRRPESSRSGRDL